MNLKAVYFHLSAGIDLSVEALNVSDHESLSGLLGAIFTLSKRHLIFNFECKIEEC